MLHLINGSPQCFHAWSILSHLLLASCRSAAIKCISITGHRSLIIAMHYRQLDTLIVMWAVGYCRWDSEVPRWVLDLSGLSSKLFCFWATLPLFWQHFSTLIGCIMISMQLDCGKQNAQMEKYEIVGSFCVRKRHMILVSIFSFSVINEYTWIVRVSLLGLWNCAPSVKNIDL